MKRTLRLALAALTLTALFAWPARAQDTDLFMTSTTANTSNPNVLIIIDNAASNNSNLTDDDCETSKKLDMELCVLEKLIESDKINKDINVGIALLNASGSTRGAYIYYHVRPMTKDNKDDLIAKIRAIGTRNNAPYASAMHEAYQYFRGEAPHAGTLGGVSYDPAAISNGKYVSPTTDACQRNYIIFLGNGGPDSGENNGAKALLAADVGQTATWLDNNYTVSLPSCCNKYQSSWADEFSKFLNGTDVAANIEGVQNITTYAVLVDNPNGPDYKNLEALFDSVAYQGGTQKAYHAYGSAALTVALTDTFDRIQAVNSVFAAVTLPVSVNVRGTNLNQVYMGLFRPEESAKQRWFGNLKEYQLKTSTTGDVYLADAAGNTATVANTDAFAPSTISYWTSASEFWAYRYINQSNFETLKSDSPDGNTAEKGGAAQYQRTQFATSQDARKLYTCTGVCAKDSKLEDTPFTTGNAGITTINTGTSSDTDLEDLIKWVRGTDIYDENANNSATDARASIHGDVIHSRPAVVNYNRHGDDHDVVVYYGANDGVFRAIQGGQLTASGPRKGGTEKWGFIPSEFFGKLKSIRDNDTAIDLTFTNNPRNPDKTYFIDGPIGIYQNDVNKDGKLVAADGDKVYLYPAMRRGGRLLYALDVSDPDEPRFLWKKSNASAGYAELGYTWSIPKPVTMKAFGNPVLIMGAGYDPTAEDGANSTGQATAQGTATMGRGIMVIDATNGDLLWQAGPNPSGATTNKTVATMTAPIPADILAIDRNKDGYIDRLYAVDTHANIWRVDCNDEIPANWTVTKIAALGGSGASARKFLYAPDLVYVSPVSGASQTYDGLFIGSGDREHPFDTSVTNRFYMIKDTNTGLNVNAGFTTITESDLYDTTSNKVQSDDSDERANAQAAMDAAKGWYITLLSGEKVVGNAVVVGGGVYFGTNQPSSSSGDSCSNLGTARNYIVHFLHGGAVFDMDGDGKLTSADRSATIIGGGFPAPPVPVTIIGDDGNPYRAVVSGRTVLKVAGTKVGQRYRTYWYNEKDQ